MNGWLSRQGEFLSCKQYKHETVARLYGGSEVQWEQKGFVKIFNDKWYCDRPITDAQEKWLINHEIYD